MKRMMTVAALCAAVSAAASVPGTPANSGATKDFNILFLGNSFTARHNMVQLVKEMAEKAEPTLHFNATQVIYGGSTLRDHWNLGSRNFVNLAVLTCEEELATIRDLEAAVRKGPANKNQPRALAQHQQMLPLLEKPRPRWDIVVLESYLDDLDGEKSVFFDYAARFAALSRAQGARVVLYETTGATQNGEPLAGPPDPGPTRTKEKYMAAFAKKIGASVVPMSSVAQACHAARPDLTLRYREDLHLNQTMAYLTVCTLYAVLLDRSPIGLPLAAITDTRPIDKQHKNVNMDGGPITRTFTAQEQAELQRFVKEGLQEFRKIEDSLPPEVRDSQARR